MENFNIRAISNHILFSFLEEVKNKAFVNHTDWGFQIYNRTDDVKHPRWAEVVSVGEKISDIKAGQYILIEPLAWTQAIKINGKNYWMTNDSKVFCVSDESPF